ncbi:MAG: RodZ domain-containing protein [Armatimonadota bacterium]
MEPIGAILKEERENKGLTLQQVHEATKITLNNLTAIEEERFDHFPNRVYARAFLRDYANFLGIDSSPLLEKYEQEWNAQKELVKTRQKKEKSAWVTVVYTLLVIIIFAGLGAIGYWSYDNYKKQSNIVAVEREVEKESEDQDMATLPKVDTDIKQPAEEKKPQENMQTQPAEKPAESVKPLTIRVRIETTNDVWVRAIVDGQKVLENVIPSGYIKTFEGKTKVNIRVGRSGAVKIMLNDEPQPPLGPIGSPGERTFTLEDIPKPAEPKNEAADSDENKPEQRNNP